MLILLLVSWGASIVGLVFGLTAHWKLDALRDELAVQRQSDLLDIAMRLEPDGPKVSELGAILHRVERFPQRH